ncbi:MAG TPA: hypothetical protein VE030_11065 [Burkholderiales bacterium]|nr:hypothetical protein [Burkholderiales bacterium]
MQSPSSYDPDLRSARRSALTSGVLNLAVVGFHVYRHSWAVVAASAVWTLSSWIWLVTIRAQQTTRDYSRVVEAATRREIERREFR